VIYPFPSVPYEMHQIMHGTILPDLARRAGSTKVIRSPMLRTWGHSESRLAELLAARIDELDAIGNPTLAFLASGIEGLKVRITASGDDESAALARIADEEVRVRELLGETVFGIDHETMESVVLDLLRARGLTLALAEVTSGGIAAMRLSALDPRGEVFRGAIVPTAGAVRTRLLGVPAELLGTFEAAKTLAQAVRHAFGADIGIATTGQHDLGDVSGAAQTYLGLAIGERVDVERVRLPGDRERVRQFAVISALNALRLHLRAA
ncbi:MAG: CinA family protein, partial [Gammaproteobacteria bacterium]